MEELARLAKGLGLALTSAQLDQFARYETLLVDWNQRLNLTAVREPSQIRLRHFFDSLTVATVTGDLNDQTVVDVGSGAGFPGLPLKILFPELKLTLVESIAKKARFLRAVVNSLQLHDVTILAERAELVGQSEGRRATQDWAVARGVAELRIVVEYLLPLCRLQGCIVAQKGESAAAEVERASPALGILGGRVEAITPVSLPGLDERHYLVVIRKIAATPEKYPRRPGMPAKRPL